MGKNDRSQDISSALGGTLNILGLKIDLAKLLSSPDETKESLAGLRERLKAAGGKESLSDEEWNGGASITGNIRTHGVLGEREFHMGTFGRQERSTRRKTEAPPVETVEPPVDVFYEKERVVIVADVPGVETGDLELKIDHDVFSLSTRANARRRYRKTLHLDSPIEPDSMQASCRNGVLEVSVKRHEKA
ncbi:MAG: Hsp20/alpha crystallin family protein [Chloroflexi bacterium]|nr:Hsp20/alpha crystallin family protein [Chloroflexota bacterium]